MERSRKISGTFTEGIKMEDKQSAVAYCLTYQDVYRDEPFHDPNWTVIRHKGNHKVFAWIFGREGHTWINVKVDPEWREVRRKAYASVLPAYHLNKEHWSSIILDGTVPDKEIKRMIEESYRLTKPKKK
jgi:predicted DNA-binding protein (MmcQ/YjbR family)